MGDQPSETQATAPSPRPPEDDDGNVSQQEPHDQISESAVSTIMSDFDKSDLERGSAMTVGELDAGLDETISKASHYLRQSRSGSHGECVDLVKHLADMLGKCKTTQICQQSIISTQIKDFDAIYQASTDLEKRALYLEDQDGSGRHQGFKALHAMQALQEEAGEAIDNLHQVMIELEDPGKGKVKPFQTTMTKLKEVIRQAQAAESDKRNLATERQISNERALEIQSLKDKCHKLKAGDFKTKIAGLNSDISTLRKELREAKYGAKATKFTLLDERTNNFRAQTSHFVDHVNMRMLAFLTDWKTYDSGQAISWKVFTGLRSDLEKLSEDVHGAGWKVMALHE